MQETQLLHMDFPSGCSLWILPLSNDIRCDAKLWKSQAGIVPTASSRTPWLIAIWMPKQQTHLEMPSWERRVAMQISLSDAGTCWKCEFHQKTTILACLHLICFAIVFLLAKDHSERSSRYPLSCLTPLYDMDHQRWLSTRVLCNQLLTRRWWPDTWRVLIRKVEDWWLRAIKLRSG